jgi:hypothetical protein
MATTCESVLAVSEAVSEPPSRAERATLEWSTKPPRGTAITFSAKVRPQFANDPEEIARLFNIVRENPRVRRDLDDLELAKLAVAIKNLVALGFDGYLYINADGSNRFIWLEGLGVPPLSLDLALPVSLRWRRG